MNDNADPYFLTPEEAHAWRLKIEIDDAHKFWEERDGEERKRMARMFVKRLLEIEEGKTNTLAGYINDTIKENKEKDKENV